MAEGEATGGAGRLDFEDRESLEAWLRTQPREVSVIIAARAALRVLPMAVSAISNRGGALEARELAVLTAALFRATALARFAGKYPTRDKEIRAASGAAATYVKDTALAVCATPSSYYIAAASYAINASAADLPAATGALATARAAEARGDNTIIAGLWATILVDVAFLRAGGSARELAEERLWPRGVTPAWAEDLWNRLYAALHEVDGWGVWTQWYEDLLKGGPVPEEIELVYATVPPEKWDEGPPAANAWIAEQLAKLEQPEDLDSLRPSPAFDFFLSYSTPDETFARFIDDVLRQAGHTVFAQFRDMPAGSNFVIEMERGLEDSGRLVALLSPSYVASKHCKAEWSAAYADDPSGEKRKLVPLLIAPADLDPLARQIVTKSLVGKTAQEAADAILAAAGYAGPSIEPKAPWPGHETLDAMARKTRGVFPARLDGDRLTVDAVAPNDKLAERYGFSAPELYADMRHAFLAYAEELETTTGNFHYPEPMRRSARALLLAAPEDMGKCRPLPMNRALKMALQALDRADRAGELPEHDMAHYHRAELRGLYERLAAIYTELLDYRELDRNERMRPPSPEERRFLDELLRETAADDAVATPELQNELRGSSAALAEAARNLPPGASEEARKQELREPLKAATAQAIPLWAWLSDARRKFEKAGKSAKEAEDAIANFTKLAQRISGAAAFFKWISEWWF